MLILKVLFKVLSLAPVYLCQGSSGSSTSHSSNIPTPLRGEIASSLGGLLGYNSTPTEALGGLPQLKGVQNQQNNLQNQIARMMASVSSGKYGQGKVNTLNKKIAADQSKLAAFGPQPGSPGTLTGPPSTTNANPGGGSPQQNALNQLLQNAPEYKQLGEQETAMALDPTSSSTFQKMMAALQQQFLNNLGEANVQTGSRFAQGGHYDPNSSSPLAAAFAQQAGTGEQALETAGLQQAFGLIPTEQTAASQYQMTTPNLLAMLGSLLGVGSSGGTQISGGI